MENKFKKHYHIFKCLDYKGGELCSNINLTKDEALSELYENWVDDNPLSIDDLKLLSEETLKKSIEDWENKVYSTYGDTYPKVYETTSSGELEEIEFSIKDIKDWLKNY